MQGCQRKPRLIRAGCPYEWMRRADEPGLVPYLWAILVELAFLELGALGRNFGPMWQAWDLREWRLEKKFVELVIRILCTYIGQSPDSEDDRNIYIFGMRHSELKPRA